jgi:hypothetical protein
MKRVPPPVAFYLLIAGFLIFAGCATPGIDWNTRIGAYTYDDAITELGVPDRSATLSDGSLVAEWLQARGQAFATSYGFSHSRFRSYDVTQFPDQYLRLVFAPDHRLRQAETFAR